ncbi:uncharacterized protein LOC108623645 [Ceratina calcarata]|uniref:Uncharacterized protein LOC108623645 n=1 Tax=Ceratina calcarata TaxID=156304 RepID=A0AAJ7N4X9_9HYME|nr:uncharacterized protein LOC108623645 [Ceratina calcarata]
MEIVIENPMKSPPHPPKTPPPLLPLTMSPWNAIVTASSTLPSTTSPTMPTTTTVMTITIAENPTAIPSYPLPIRFAYRETYANSHPYCNPYTTARRVQSRGRPYDDPDGAPSLSVRRVDKSGLLGITEPEAPGTRTGLRPPRLLSGVNSASGMLSPRRLECVGQLDPVPEVPGQVTRANVAPGASNAFLTNDIRLDPCEPLPGTLARPIKSASFDSLESRHTLQNLNRELDGIEFSDLSEVSGYASSFRLQESCDARIRTLGRLSRLAHVTTNENSGKYTETCCNFPFAERGTPQFPGFEETSSLPTTRATVTTATTSTTTVAVSTIKEIREKDKDVSEDAGKKKNHAPEEVRAEAEGCEHGAEDSLKDGESSQRGDEFQTLRVIIRSEQL